MFKLRQQQASTACCCTGFSTSCAEHSETHTGSMCAQILVSLYHMTALGLPHLLLAAAAAAAWLGRGETAAANASSTAGPNARPSNDKRPAVGCGCCCGCCCCCGGEGCCGSGCCSCSAPLLLLLPPCLADAQHTVYCWCCCCCRTPLLLCLLLLLLQPKCGRAPCSCCCRCPAAAALCCEACAVQRGRALQMDLLCTNVPQPASPWPRQAPTGANCIFAAEG